MSLPVAVNTSPFHVFLTRRLNTWYTVCDGNWSDPTIWMSNALDRKNVSLPMPGDNVMINHTVTYNNNLAGSYLFNNNINNLIINGNLFCAVATNPGNFIISGNLQCNGTLDFSANTGNSGGIKITIGGTVNYVMNFVTGGSTSNITIYYNSPFSFAIPALRYYGLQIGGGLSSIKTTTTDLNVDAILTVDASTTFELGSFNATVKDLSIAGTLGKNSSSGNLAVTNSTSGSLFGSSGKVSFSGSPTVNWSGNMKGDLRNGINFGSGTFNILTSSTWQFDNSGNNPASIGTCNFIITSGATVTLTGGAPWINNGTITGVDGTSVLNVSTSYCIGNSSAIMPTGVFNHNFSGTSAIWASGTTTTIPGLTFYDLTIQSGTAILSGNVTVSHTLTVSSTLQLSTFDLTSSGTTACNGSMLKSGSGTVNFTTVTNNSVGSSSINFSAGNPTVNLYGNFTGDWRSGLNFGSSVVNILQSINIGIFGGGNVAISVTASFLIASGKTLTNTGFSSTAGGITTSGTINGADGTAIFDNRSMFTYNNATAPMFTGLLYCNQAANTFIYGLIGNQDITSPSDPTPGYKNLTLQGSGAKQLLGNVSVKGLYTLTSPATLNSNGFSLTNP